MRGALPAVCWVWRGAGCGVAVLGGVRGREVFAQDRVDTGLPAWAGGAEAGDDVWVEPEADQVFWGGERGAAAWGAIGVDGCGCVHTGACAVGCDEGAEGFVGEGCEGGAGCGAVGGGGWFGGWHRVAAPGLGAGGDGWVVTGVCLAWGEWGGQVFL
jgi:hypothetical protein